MLDALVPHLTLAAEGGATDPGVNTGLLLIAALTAIAFVVGHVTRRFMSEVIVFLAIGIVAGPTVLGLIDNDALGALDPVVSLSLGAIVFGIGERLELPKLREIGPTLWPIAVLENVAVFALSLVGLLLVGVDIAVAFLLAAIALSTSPTTLVAVIASRRARGGFTNHMMAATAVNNVTSAAIYGIGLPIVLAVRGGTQVGVLAFLQLVVLSLVVGGAGAWVLRRWMADFHRAGERLLFVLVVLISVVAISTAVAAPVVISTLVMGALTANDQRDTRPLFEALRVLEAPIFLVFFLVAGAGIHLDELVEVGGLGLVFVLARLAGKVGGGWIGADLTRSGRRSGWGPWVGAGLMPFAGMAIGLAAFTIERATEAGLESLGLQVSAIVFGSVVVFELLGPITVGKALDATGESGRDRSDEEEDLAEPHLIRHILVPLSSPEMARRKAPQIVDLAASSGAVITGLHIVPPGGSPDPNVGAPALSFVGQVAASRGVQFEPVVREAASVVACIAEEARRAAVDLVMLGEPAPRMLEQGGTGRRIVHEVTRALPAGVRVLVVPTVMDEPPPASGIDESADEQAGTARAGGAPT